MLSREGLKSIRWPWVPYLCLWIVMWCIGLNSSIKSIASIPSTIGWLALLSSFADFIATIALFGYVFRAPIKRAGFDILLMIVVALLSAQIAFELWFVFHDWHFLQPWVGST